MPLVDRKHLFFRRIRMLLHIHAAVFAEACPWFRLLRAEGGIIRREEQLSHAQVVERSGGGLAPCVPGRMNSRSGVTLDATSKSYRLLRARETPDEANSPPKVNALKKPGFNSCVWRHF